VVNPFSSNRRARSKYLLASLPPLLLALIFPLSAAEVSTPSPESSPSVSKTTRFGRKLTVGAVNTLLEFDRLFRQSSTAVSERYLDRVADPKSDLHPLYLNYKQGRINQAELVASLPHVALLGDSLSKNFYISTVPSVFWRTRTELRKNWFLDSNPSPNSIYSLDERIDKIAPLVATDYARTGALVTAHSGDEDLIHMLGHTPNFPGQVDQVLKPKRFPDLLLLWIGNNNLDWVHGASPSEREHPEKYLQKRVSRFRKDYTRQMRRIISRAEGEDHPVAIVVFGIVNCGSYFQARKTAEELRAKDHNLYPYLEVDYRRAESLKPEYRQTATRLQRLLNRELQSVVRDLRDELQPYPKVRLQYSDVLAKLDISKIEMINAHDAWHFSPLGHDRVAQTVFAAIAPSLDFLGIGSGTYGSRRSQLHQ
jgi:hypothetical protein